MIKGLPYSNFPRQDDFRNFCMSEEAEMVFKKLEQIINIYWVFKNPQKVKNNNKIFPTLPFPIYI